MTEAQKLEFEIMQKSQQLAELRRKEAGVAVTDYRFATLEGDISLSDLFAGHDRLLLIHNMGQGCRYCTLWADGINGILAHLEDSMAVALVSKDPPEIQRLHGALLGHVGVGPGLAVSPRLARRRRLHGRAMRHGRAHQHAGRHDLHARRRHHPALWANGFRTW